MVSAGCCLVTNDPLILRAPASVVVYLLERVDDCAATASRLSLVCLGNSFEFVKGMKPVPFGKDTLLQLAVISLAPVAPLVLTMIPLGELLDQCFLTIVTLVGSVPFVYWTLDRRWKSIPIRCRSRGPVFAGE